MGIARFVAIFLAIMWIAGSPGVQQDITDSFHDAIEAAKKHDFTMAIRALQPLPEKGDALGQYFLALAYEERPVSADDLAKATCQRPSVAATSARSSWSSGTYCISRRGTKLSQRRAKCET